MASISNSLIFPQTFRGICATVTAANTTYTGSAVPANVVLLVTAGANGSLVRRLKARPVPASGSTSFTATQAQLLRYTGSAIFLDDDASMVAQTLSNTTGATPVDFAYTDAAPRYLPSGYSLYVGIGVAWAPGVIFTADVGDF